MTHPEPHPATIIGRFVIDGEVGRGGMGVVYRARDPLTGSPVAIKLAGRPAEEVGEVRRRRFLREARAVAGLRHSSIVGIREVGETDDGRPFIAMDFVEGSTFEELLVAGVLDRDTIAAIFAAVASALGHAHERGVLHRDVKPENVIVDRRGRPYLIDFGLARREDTVDALTAPGQLVGTLAYLAPEQVSDAHGRIGPSTDVYALGGSIYRALVGRPPFQATSTVELIRAILVREPTDPRALDPSIPGPLATIAMRCLRKDPGTRYASAGEVAADLRRAGRGESLATVAPARRGGATAFAIGVGLLVGTAGAIAAALAIPGALAARRDATATTASIAGVESPADVVVERSPSPPDGPPPAPVSPEEGSPAPGEELDDEPSDDVGWNDLDEPGTDPETRRLLALTIERCNAGDFAAARSFIETAIERQPELAMPYVGRATVRTAFRDLAGALEDYDRAVARRPGRAMLWARRGAVRRLAGQLAPAIEDLRRALELNPNLPAVEVDLGLTLRMAGELEDSVLAFGRAIALQPGAWNGLVERARSLMLLSRFDEARVDVDRAIELAPRQPRAWLLRGVIRRHAGDPENARADLDRAIALGERSWEAPFYRGLLRWHQRADLAGAWADLTRAGELDPRNAIIWGNRALVAVQRGDSRAAIADFGRVLAIDPNQVEALLLRSKTRLFVGEVAEGLVDAERALALAPADANAILAYAHALGRNGRWSEASAQLDRIERAQAGSAEFHAIRGDVLAATGDDERSIAAYGRALELVPSFVSALVGRAFVLARRGDVDGALAAIAEARRHAAAGMRPSIAIETARVQGLLGRPAEAASALDHFLELFPTDPAVGWARDALARLRRGEEVEWARR